MMVSNCPILHDGVKLSAVSNSPRCQIVLFALMVSNCPTFHNDVKLSEVSNCPRCQIVLGSLRWLGRSMWSALMICIQKIYGIHGVNHQIIEHVTIGQYSAWAGFAKKKGTQYCTMPHCT